MFLVIKNKIKPTNKLNDDCINGRAIGKLSDASNEYIKSEVASKKYINDSFNDFDLIICRNKLRKRNINTDKYNTPPKIPSSEKNCKKSL